MKIGFMAARETKKVILLVFVTFSLISSRDVVTGRRGLSKEEDWDLDRQLKFINKPAAKSIQTKYGDILDCIDINKQLAFDHPLLKNHTIQIRPKFIPKGMIGKASSTMTSSQFIFKNIGCPPGTVPIRRTQKEDLMMAKYLSLLGRKYPTNILPLSNNQSGHHFAVLEMKSGCYGSKAHLNIWGPSVSNDQFSLASIWLVNGAEDEINTIQAGWIVNPYLFQNFTRLYTYWTADGYHRTGCFNTNCPGFVQVSTEIYLGIILNPLSTYAGEQYEIPLSVYQDHDTGNWWLIYGEDKYVGYWPKSIFTTLAHGASKVAWGGETFSPQTEPSPSMGSGHFSKEGFRRSCYFNRIQVADQTGTFFNLNAGLLDTYADEPKCYDIINGGNSGDEWGNYMYFGGPGLCIFQ
ncbi:hypothetical protein HHK36_027712 [Tetracentron sinense]|uniref:Neprosin PEP catalytic domain-containing protein n=1 Tax=Tetracentron sinense TaxID=13715 RepID=A0A835D1T0_TETSI|nr:hypothetical protein HHK36_027712 [Tetracentron sinense]